MTRDIFLVECVSMYIDMKFQALTPKIQIIMVLGARVPKQLMADVNKWPFENCHLWADVATPNQTFWTQPNVFSPCPVHILDIINCGWGHRPWGGAVAPAKSAQKSCADAPNCPFGAYLTTPHQHIWTQPSVSNQRLVTILDLENFGWHQKPR